MSFFQKLNAFIGGGGCSKCPFITNVVPFLAFSALPFFKLRMNPEYATTQELVKELDISAISISCAAHKLNTNSIVGCHMSWLMQVGTTYSGLHSSARISAQGQNSTPDRRKRGWSAPGEPVSSVTKHNLTNKNIMLCIGLDWVVLSTKNI